MPITGLRNLVVTTPGGVEGPPAKVASTALPALAHVVGYRPLVGLGPGEATTKPEGPSGREVTIAQESEITETTREDLMQMAISKLETLIDERRKRSPDEFNRWLSDSMHGADLDFFSRFAKEIPGTEVFEVEKGKLKEFMGTDAGLMLVAHMEQRDAEEARWADNIMDALGPESPGPSVLRETVHEVQGSGPLRKAARGLNYWLRTPSGRPGGRGLETANTQGLEQTQRFFIDTNGRITATVTAGTLSTAAHGAAFGFVVGNLVVPGLGGGVGAGIGAGAGALTALLTAGGIRLSRRGETTGVELSPEALRYMIGQNNATIEWSKAMSGINPLDRQVIGNEIMMRPGHVSEAAMNTRDRQERHEARALRLRRIQDKLGIRNEYQDTNIMRWLLEGSLLRPEPGTKFMKDVMDEFDSNNETFLNAAGGGIRDINGNSFWEPDPAAPNGRRRNLNFNPAQLNIFENIDRWRQAYDRVLRREITIIANDILANKTDLRGDLIKLIREKRTAKSADKDRRLSQLGKEVAAYKKDGENLGSGEKGAGKRLTEFQTSTAKTRGEIDKTLSSISVGGATPASLDAAETALANLIGAGGAPAVSIDRRTINSLTDLQNTLDADISNAITQFRTDNVDTIRTQIQQAQDFLIGIPAFGGVAAVIGERARVDAMPTATSADRDAKKEAQKELRKLESQFSALKEQFNEANASLIKFTTDVYTRNDFVRRQQAIDNDREFVNTKLEAIRTQQQKIEEAMGSTNEARTNASEVIESLRPAMDTIVGWGVAGLDQAALAGQQFDELMRRVTTRTGVYTPGAPNGWPAGERFDETNRMLLLNAMAEARAIAAEPSVGAPTTRLPDIIAAGGIPEIDLLLLSPDEIVDLSTSRGIPVAPPSRVEAVAAKDEATRRFNARQTALGNIQREIEVRHRRVEAEEKRIREKGIETPELDAMERIVGRFDAIRDGIMDNEDQLDFLDRFLSLNNVPALAAGGAAPIPNAVFADYERPQAGAAPVIEGLVRIRRLISDHTNDSQASFRGGLNGSEAAYARNGELIIDNDIRDLLVQGLNLGGMIPGVPALGIAPTPIPIPNVRVAMRLARMATGVDPTPPALVGILNRTMVTPVEVARCFSQDLFRLLAQRVEKY